ncbi:54K polar flagellar sheath protein A [Vibrio mytili]|uniref:54K polar flagellar sheath protein A n=1 Tax=Vibrio mytili TaxID=50718 RepID=UPI002F3FE026
MKQLKIVPLVAIISGIMVGCGGGGGGGGGAPRTAFTFDFAIPTTMTAADAKAQNCTVYERGNGTATVLTYSKATGAQVTNNVIGYYSDENGKRQGDIIKPTGDSFDFVLEDIPEGGYITFQALEFNAREIRVNSFSREFLEDKKLRTATFALNRDKVNRCLQGNNLADKTFKNLSYRNVVSGGGDYHYISQTDSLVSPNYDMAPSEELVGFNGEPTALFQYAVNSNKTELHQYGIGSWGTGDIDLVATDVSSRIYSSSRYNYDDLKIGFVANNFLYDALVLNRSNNDYNRPSDTSGEVWAFEAASANSGNGWETTLTGTIDAGWDIDVDPSRYLNINGLPNTKPTVSSNGEIDLNMGLNSSTEGFVRTAYFASSGDYKVTHRIFSKSNSDYIVVPELHYYNFPSSAVNGLVVTGNDAFNRSALITDENSDINSRIFLSLFANGKTSEPELEADLDGILTPEEEATKNGVTLRTSDALVVTRFN